ncbi:MAG: ZrgA family zinc uptake protein [Oceanisphaera sp.]|uniref:ZrgA family zinc uptake protein n=1 Tax=Oceanisphaera sp. TaxID=1929979 RepID=UPI003F9BB27A
MFIKPLLFTLPLLPLAALAQAQPQAHQDTVHQLGVHQHGFGRLSLALDQQQLVLELFAPAADIVGFEHTPNTAEQRTQYQTALTRVQDGDLLFTLPTAAACQLLDSQLIAQHQGDLEAAAHHHDDHPHHDHAHKHEHDEHHASHEDHDDEHHADHDHSDILVAYRYQCQQPQALTELSTQLFEQFTSFTHIELQGIVPTGQVAASLTPNQATASW